MAKEKIWKEKKTSLKATINRNLKNLVYFESITTISGAYCFIDIINIFYLQETEYYLYYDEKTEVSTKAWVKYCTCNTDNCNTAEEKNARIWIFVLLSMPLILFRWSRKYKNTRLNYYYVTARLDWLLWRLRFGFGNRFWDWGLK